MKRGRVIVESKVKQLKAILGAGYAVIAFLGHRVGLRSKSFGIQLAPLQSESLQGLSAGRVQSVALRRGVKREQALHEIVPSRIVRQSGSGVRAAVLNFQANRLSWGLLRLPMGRCLRNVSRCVCLKLGYFWLLFNRNNCGRIVAVTCFYANQKPRRSLTRFCAVFDKQVIRLSYLRRGQRRWMVSLYTHPTPLPTLNPFWAGDDVKF